MMGRSFLKLALAVVAALALAAPAYAGGVAIEFDSPPENVEADVAFTFGFTIRSAHEDRTPQPGLAPLIQATNSAADQRVEATARPEGAPGHYVATLTFPVAGAWQWRIQPFGKGESYSLTLPGPLAVREKGAPAANQQTAPAMLVDAKGIDDAFDPTEMTVPAGTTVRWNMAGQRPHTVTSVGGAFASGNIDPGKSYEFTFAEPGTYAYYCEYHGSKDGQGMFGKVIVTAAAAAPAGAADAQAPLPRTGGADLALPGALLAALAVAGAGIALRWRGRVRKV
jgi:plastocyanin